MPRVDDPNINPVWDRLLGTDTNTGAVRLLAALMVFFLLGGGIVTLLGAV
ncbi:hypothetical protein NAC44_16830 [Allorhizobium sp. BGMRC 0089]|nr:hypothetical protein [Allorhizobium sonneratiae]MCM2293992.1 hypothetical protein [Allorhizobium sonneratiae]